MNTQTLNVYEIFKKSLSEDEAKEIIAYIDDSRDIAITSAVNRKIEHLATKEDLAKQIGDLKAETVKWMFIFWAGLFLPLIALIITLF